MKIIVTGRAAPLRSEMVKGLEREGHKVTLVTDRRKWPADNYDLCVDTAAGGMRDIRRTVDALVGKRTHYILLSSYRVYPRVPRLTPWRPEDIDLSDEAGVEPLDVHIRGQRAAERELRIRARNRVAWTIMRPAIIEIKNAPEPQNMWWFVSRVMDGKPFVLPDEDDPLFRHVSDADLIRAVVAVACREEAYYETIHVVDRALLSFESYARLIMKSLHREVPLIRVRVSADLWKAAGLSLPMGRELNSSFIDSSLLLNQLGWQPADEETWVEEYAKGLASQPLESFPQRQRELSLLNTPTVEVIPAVGRFPEGWRITGIAGEPNSMRLQYEAEKNESRLPLLRCRKVALGIADELFLLEGSGSRARVLGQNALLEALDPGNAQIRAGELYIPFSRQSCVITDCERCDQLAQGLSGADQDGFARELIREVPGHLVPISGEIASFALLAHPLSCLLSVLPYVFLNATGPIWIYGRRIESVLAGFLAADAEKPVLHIDRSTVRGALPKETPLLSLGKARDNVRKKTLAPPAAVINLSAARDGENLLAGVLQQKGLFISPFVATGVHSRRLNVNLPVLAPGRQWLEMAAATLERWATVRDLGPLLRRVSNDQLPELFLSGSFQLPFLEIA